MLVTSVKDGVMYGCGLLPCLQQLFLAAVVFVVVQRSSIACLLCLIVLVAADHVAAVLCTTLCLRVQRLVLEARLRVL
jgi:hypothetical protein